MAGFFKLALHGLVASHCFLVPLMLALNIPLAAMASSSLSSFWHHELPHTSMPDTLQKLASPLSTSRIRHYLAQLKAGTTLQALKNDEFCSSAGIYCPQKAVVVSGNQPRVCVPPSFFYEYGVLHCQRNGGFGLAFAVQSSSSMFFSQDSLVVDKVMQLPDTSNDLKGLKFLPHALAKALPELSEHNMLKLAKFYGVAKGSNMELAMEDTLGHCAYKSEHEVRECLTSGEGMVSFVAKAIGHNAMVYAPPAVTSQQAKVVDIAAVPSERVVSCHDMKFPSLLYSCHMIQSSELMDVSLKLADGHVEHMPAICHMDTSYWNPAHFAFQFLNAEPGKSSICHWFPQNSFVFAQGLN